MQKELESYRTLQELLEQYQEMKHRLAAQLDWDRLARPNQREPMGDWLLWMILAGRGYGKTRTGAETLKKWVASGKARRIALVGATESDARHVMIEGTSGIMSVYAPGEQPHYEPSKRQLTWPNGTVAHIFSADAPDQLRGPQFDAAWVDEFAKFDNPEETWGQLKMCMRLGTSPRVIVTTTPRPIPFLKRLAEHPSTVLTRGSTFENEANLAPSFLAGVKSDYEGTKIGRQELYAEFLEDEEDALWTHNMIEKAHETEPELPCRRVVVAVDPAVTSSENSAETGIIVAGVDQKGRGVVLEDLSCKGPPTHWIQVAIEAYHRFQADRIIAEVNQGGDLVEEMLRMYDPNVSYLSVRATRGKVIRAEPVAALYERGKILHAKPFPTLEKQLTSYVPWRALQSPDRMDALVWALSELMLKRKMGWWSGG